MRNANTLSLNLISLFNTAITERLGYDPVPGIKYAKITLGIEADTNELIDGTSMNNIKELFTQILNEFGTDIPNDDKTDILFIIEKYVKAVQFSQCIILVFKQFIAYKIQTKPISDMEYDNLQTKIINHAQHLQDDETVADAVVDQIVNDFGDLIKPTTIHDTIHNELTYQVKAWSNLLLD